MVKKNVLIVDDEHLILELCTRFLTNAGFQVTSTSSGGEAVQLCQKGHFDLILSDVRMPGMNGLELVKTIKK
ncbi:MAG TPA: response regulator, partial [Nitrospiria bacterium]|nr:response regulator [Nitrospiria bacterium]